MLKFIKELVSKPKSPKNTYMVSEGIAGMFFYHLSTPDNPYTSLCGREVMGTGFQIFDFPIKLADHIPHGNCQECIRLSGLGKEEA